MDREKLRPLILEGLRAKLTLDEMERGWKKLIIEESLGENNGHQGATAAQLGMHRNSLIRWINELQIDVKQFKWLTQVETRRPRTKRYA